MLLNVEHIYGKFLTYQFPDCSGDEASGVVPRRA